MHKKQLNRYRRTIHIFSNSRIIVFCFMAIFAAGSIDTVQVRASDFSVKVNYWYNKTTIHDDGEYSIKTTYGLVEPNFTFPLHKNWVMELSAFKGDFHSRFRVYVNQYTYYWDTRAAKFQFRTVFHYNIKKIVSFYFPLEYSKFEYDRAKSLDRDYSDRITFEADQNTFGSGAGLTLRTPPHNRISEHLGLQFDYEVLYLYGPLKVSEDFEQALAKDIVYLKYEAEISAIYFITEWNTAFSLSYRIDQKFEVLSKQDRYSSQSGYLIDEIYYGFQFSISYGF